MSVTDYVIGILLIAVIFRQVRHDITGAQTWTAALVLMAFGQVPARVGVLQVRRVRAATDPAARGRVPADTYAGRPVQ